MRSDDSIVTVNWIQPGPERQPPHAHPFDQLSFVLQGTIEFDIDGEIFLLGPGEVISIPADVPHMARIIGDETVINVDVCAPAREDYLYFTDYFRRGLRSTPARAARCRRQRLRSAAGIPASVPARRGAAAALRGRELSSARRQMAYAFMRRDREKRPEEDVRRDAQQTTLRLRPGDVVEGEITGLGRQRNAASHPPLAEVQSRF